MSIKKKFKQPQKEKGPTKDLQHNYLLCVNFLYDSPKLADYTESFDSELVESACGTTSTLSTRLPSISITSNRILSHSK